MNRRIIGISPTRSRIRLTNAVVCLTLVGDWEVYLPVDNAHAKNRYRRSRRELASLPHGRRRLRGGRRSLEGSLATHGKRPDSSTVAYSIPLPVSIQDGIVGSVGEKFILYVRKSSLSTNWHTPRRRVVVVVISIAERRVQRDTCFSVSECGRIMIMITLYVQSCMGNFGFQTRPGPDGRTNTSRRVFF